MPHGKPTSKRPGRKGRQPKSPLTHIDSRGRVRMVDVGGKPVVRRRAVAEGLLFASKATLDALEAGKLPKGEALAAARIAGIQAAKKCAELIPLCHSLPLDAVSIDFDRAAWTQMRITAVATVSAKTGVEMEALTAVAVTALTLYDMAKAIDKSMHIEGIRLIEKSKS